MSNTLNVRGKNAETSLASLNERSGRGFNNSYEAENYEEQRLQAKEAKKKGLDHLYK